MSTVWRLAVGIPEAVSAVLKEESNQTLTEQKAGAIRVKLETICGASLTPRMPNCERKAPAGRKISREMKIGVGALYRLARQGSKTREKVF
jgi:hypothetical protein